MALKNLGYLLDNEINAKVLSSEGSSGIRGTLQVRYVPTNDSGEGEPDDENIPDEPTDLIGKTITFRVEIDKAGDLPKDLSKNVFVTYTLNFDKLRNFQTDEFNGRSPNPVFNYKKVHHVDAITSSVIKYIENG